MECPHCHGALIYPDGPNGEAVCTRCGLVTHQPGTAHGYTRRATELPSNWSEDDSDTRREWITTLRTVSDQLKLPDFPYREEAARIINTSEHALQRSKRFGRNKREAVAALLYLVLREYGVIRPLREISATLNLNHRTVAKYAWEMRKRTHLDRTYTPTDYLRKYGWNLTRDPNLIQRAEDLITHIKTDLSGNPISIAAGALLLISRTSRLKVTKEQVGRAFNISGRTVHANANRIRDLITQKMLTNTKQDREKETIVGLQRSEISAPIPFKHI